MISLLFNKKKLQNHAVKSSVMNQISFFADVDPNFFFIGKKKNLCAPLVHILRTIQILGSVFKYVQ